MRLTVSRGAPSGQFARLYGGDSGPVGTWFTRWENVLDSNGNLRSAQELQEIFALEYLPTHIEDVVLPDLQDIAITASVVAPHPDRGGGGGIQLSFDEPPDPAWFINQEEIK